MSAKKKTRKKKKNTKAARAKKTRPKQKAAGKKTVRTKKKLRKKRALARGRSEVTDIMAFEPKGLGPLSGGQSGDLQGLSEVAVANSESVAELLEEGNPYEAEVVKGIEDVRDADEEKVTPPEEAEEQAEEETEEEIPEEYRGGEQ